jgi:hypothetical protein
MIKSEPEPPLYILLYIRSILSDSRKRCAYTSVVFSFIGIAAGAQKSATECRARVPSYHQMPPGADALSPISHLPAHPAGEGHHLWDGDRFPFPGAFNSCSCSRWVYFRQRVPQRLSIHQTHSWVTDEWNKEKRKQTRTQTTPTSASLYASERESCLWENFCILCVQMYSCGSHGVVRLD